MATDVADDLAHMRIIVLGKFVGPLPEDPKDLPAAGVADAFVGRAVPPFQPTAWL